jgi:hypothetical protein
MSPGTVYLTVPIPPRPKAAGEFCRDVDHSAIGSGMDQIIPLLAAFGLGSIVTALVQSALANRTRRFDRIFSEKQVAYVGLLEACHRASVEGTDEAAKNVAYWQVRCDLVGSDAVCDAIRRMVETTDDREGRLQTDSDLRLAMRSDLKISN